MRPIATPHPTSASRGTAAVAECFSAQTIFEPLGATRASLIPSPGRSGWQQGARPGRSARRCPDLGSCESARPYDEAFPRQAASRPFSSHRRARLLAPILGIIASSRVCALCRSSTVRKPAFVKARALASVNPRLGGGPVGEVQSVIVRGVLACFRRYAPQSQVSESKSLVPAPACSSRLRDGSDQTIA
jgi:hypothetical protein